jgi:hypothetical protein
MPFHADRILGYRHARAKSRLLHQLPEFHVVDHFHRQAAVRAASFVCAALQHLERAHADVRARIRIAHRGQIRR